MKKLILFLFTLNFFLAAGAQVLSNLKFTYFNGPVPVYTVDDCLVDLFYAIEEADSNYTRYPPNIYFYQVDYRRIDEGYATMLITPSRWTKSLTIDFKGVVVIGKVFFMILEDNADASYFQPTNKTVDLKLKSPIAYSNDSVDVQTYFNIYSPSLYGRYVDCEGITIYLTVALQGSLQDYDVMEQSDYNLKYGCIHCDITLATRLISKEKIAQSEITNLFCTGRKSCLTNVEFMEVFNESVFACLEKNTKGFIKEFSNAEDKDFLVHQLQNPINDEINLRRLREKVALLEKSTSRTTILGALKKAIKKTD